MGSERLREWQENQALSAEHLNEPVRELSRRHRLSDYDAERVRNGNSPEEGEQYGGWILGVIVSTGPDDQADFTDERYWVQEQFIVRGDDDKAAIELEDVPPFDPDDGGGEVKLIRCVSNLPEALEHSHGLAVGTPVLFRALYDSADWTSDQETAGDAPDAPNVRYVMTMGGPADEGQYQGEIKQMVAQRVPGWAYGPIVTALSL